LKRNNLISGMLNLCYALMIALRVSIYTMVIARWIFCKCSNGQKQTLIHCRLLQLPQQLMCI